MLSSGVCSSVFTTISGFTGDSNGLEIPVKSLISPERAFLYKPLTSLFSHVSSVLSIYTSRKSFSEIIFFA